MLNPAISATALTDPPPFTAAIAREEATAELASLSMSAFDSEQTLAEIMRERDQLHDRLPAAGRDAAGQAPWIPADGEGEDA